LQHDISGDAAARRTPFAGARMPRSQNEALSIQLARTPARLAPMDAQEQAKHAGVIERLALELERSVVEVRPLYEDILAQLRAQACVGDYLPILVSKRIRRLLLLA